MWDYSNLIQWYQMTDVPNEVNRHRHYHNHTNVQETAKLYSTNCVNFFLILTLSALRVDLRSVKKIKTLIIYHPIFNERSIGSTMI